MIGVLALQGAFQKHLECLQLLKASSKLVKTSEDLSACEALVLPGGESTAHFHLMDQGFREDLQLFCQTKPILATCCGLILLSKQLYEDPLETFAVLDTCVQRNAYGSQRESFFTTLDASLGPRKVRLKGCFIRAPQILEVGQSVRVLARYQDQPVLVQQGNIVAATFHPEVVGELALHRYFLEQLSRRCLVDSHRIG